MEPALQLGQVKANSSARAKLDGQALCAIRISMNVWLGRLVVGMPLARTRLGPSPAPVMPGTLELLLLVILALVSSSSLAISPVGRIRLNSFFFFSF